jgi:hypothetical protein
MWRTIAAIVAGLVAWAVVVTILNFGLRLWLPGYVQVEHAMAFTLPMKIARLLMAAVTSLAAGAVVRAVAPASDRAPWIVGLVILLLFLPSHFYLWNKFPIWYHLSFLVPLVPLVVLGAQLWTVGTRGIAHSREDVLRKPA